MDFRIRGDSFSITPDAVLSATRNVSPNPVDGRNKYFVTLHNQHFPIKQAVRLVTGLPPVSFTAQDAHRILSRLGFRIFENQVPPNAVTPDTLAASAIEKATDPEGAALRLLVVFERDEDGWEVASCPTLPGCHSQGRTRAEALDNIREAIRGYLASMREHDATSPTSSEFQVLEVRV